MKWVRKGRVFQPAGQAPWIGSHAALPVVDNAGPSRVFFTSRDGRQQSRIGSAALSLNPLSVGAPSAAAALEPGRLGTFDDAGVTSSCIVRHDGVLYLYYTGWSLGVSVPFYLQCGLAISDDGCTFRRISDAPLLDRGPTDPFLTASPWVLIDGSTWRMWYVSGTGWERVGTEVRHRYHIKYAESDDGLTWRRTGRVMIDYASPQEYAFGRPCVLRENGVYRMWYCHRGSTYRIGYAESPDGLAWTRKDEEWGLPLAAEGWDAEMTAYPVVFRHEGRLHMLYNGNGYGRTGIGLAIEA